MEEGLGGFAFWRRRRKTEVHAPLSSSAALSATACLVDVVPIAAARAITTAPGAFNGSLRLLFDLVTSGDQEVGAPVQAKAGDLLGFLIGGGLSPKSPLGCGVINDASDCSHHRGPMQMSQAM